MPTAIGAPRSRGRRSSLAAQTAYRPREAAKRWLGSRNLAGRDWRADRAKSVRDGGFAGKTAREGVRDASTSRGLASLVLSPRVEVKRAVSSFVVVWGCFAALSVTGEYQLDAVGSGFLGVDGACWYVGVVSGPYLEPFVELIANLEGA